MLSCLYTTLMNYPLLPANDFTLWRSWESCLTSGVVVLLAALGYFLWLPAVQLNYPHFSYFHSKTLLKWFGAAGQSILDPPPYHTHTHKPQMLCFHLIYKLISTSYHVSTQPLSISPFYLLMT